MRQKLQSDKYRGNMNYKAILKTLQEYYSNLLIVQYHGKTKAKATVEKLVNLIYANMVLLQIEYAYDWKTAIGEQLNVIGQWVGVNRSYNLPALQGRTFLAYPQSSRLIPKKNTSLRQHGYSTYATYSSLSGGILRYEDLTSVDKQLTDNEFRLIVGLKIIFNNINHTAGEIDKAVWEYFGGATYYSSEAIDEDVELYYDKELTRLYGKVSSVITTPKRKTTVEAYNEEKQMYEVIYNGYYYCEQVEDEENLYACRLGRVYTTWQAHELTYNYPSELEKIMDYCEYKKVLPAPTGVNIQITQY